MGTPLTRPLLARRAGVPTVWEMIRKGALAKVDAGGPVARTMFGIALKVNMAYIHGGGIPIVHFVLSKLFTALVFRKFHSLGAPLHAFHAPRMIP